MYIRPKRMPVDAMKFKMIKISVMGISDHSGLYWVPSQKHSSQNRDCYECPLK
jgi:hypothetical protein